MGKRVFMLGTAVALAALTIGMALPASGSSRHPDRSHTFRVTATVTEVSQIDLGAKGSSVGDEIVFSGKLLRRGTEVGHQGAICTTVSMQRHEAQCNATYALPGGQITAQAVFVLGSPAPYSVAVTGGTGR